MFLAVDIGNTQTVIGLFKGENIVSRWRLSSGRERTEDEFTILLRGLLTPTGYGPGQFEGAAMSSVVPSVATALRSALEKLVQTKVLVVEPGIRTGMAIRIDNPHEVGADRVVNSVAARERYGAPAVVVDFGTATTFDVVDQEGAYIGGAIAPGLEVSMDALVSATAALRRVDLVEPRSVVGRGTVEAIQSGLLYGYAGLVDGILGRILKELETEPGRKVATVATGGIAPVVVALSESVNHLDPTLTLEGLRLIWELNL
ncbi:MAG: type III pantothenate kinase [Acidimicrobiia bacterium]|nr:type III pantothenate kinase [Acidimicrobiia bacterium]